MDHENQLKKHQYRNWVKGGLSLKYLKDGIIGFVDESIKIEHTRILNVVNQTPILACNVCNYRNLKPNHACYKDIQTGKLSCPRGQLNCNCLDKKKKPCPKKVCDVIFEEILGCHSSTPPAPNWRNSDINTWCSNPLEIAKCYINAPGYADKVSINDIDVQGLLQILIHNISLHSNLACDMTADNVFKKTLLRRNTLFHSPSMEMEDKELNECIDDIIAILEDDIALRRRSDSRQAILNLKQLKQKDFHITTSNETEVFKAAMASFTAKTNELNEKANGIQSVIDKSKSDIESRHANILLELQTRENALESQKDQNAEAIQNIAEEQKEQGNQVESLDLRVSSLESRFTKAETDTSDLKKRLEEVKEEVNALNTSRDLKHDHLEYIKKKQDLQERLVERYKNHYVKTSICPLKTQENDVEISEVYTSPDMVLDRNSTYNETIGKMSARRRYKPSIMYTNLYKDIFQTDGQKSKRIYILGEAGSGKSSFCKMMIHNWCKCFDVEKDKTRRSISSCYRCSAYNDINYAAENVDHTVYHIDRFCNWCFHDLSNCKNIKEMKGFHFLFFIPLQCMSGFSNDIHEMIERMTEDIATKQMIDKIFETESEKCLILIDSLDEWSSGNDNKPVLPHVTKGKPKLNKIKDATVVILSRPSARGILTMKSSEWDLKIHLLGIPRESVEMFIERYMTRLKSMYSLRSFLQMIAETKLQNVEKTPMLLQQILWMHCCGQKIGHSTGDVYSSILNTMLAWYDEKQNEGEQKIDTRAKADGEYQNWQLPKLLSRYPRCISNMAIICLLSKVAFQTLITAKNAINFSRSKLETIGLSDLDISTVLKLGLVCEKNCFDPSYERTRLSFTHKSFLECFAAIYITSHCPDNKQTLEMNLKSNIDTLFKDTRSVDDILQLENMLILVSGFSPYLITRMSEHIYEAVLKDKQMCEYRKMPPLDKMVPAPKVVQVQRLISKFASEAELAGLNDLTLLLCDIQLCSFTEIIMLHSIITNKVLSLNVFSYEMKRYELELISRMRQIQSVYISQEDVKCLPHECCDTLASFLSQTDTLRSIHLLGVTCQKKECMGHDFDLSKNHELQTICVKCLHMCVSKISSSALESFTVEALEFHKDISPRSFSSSLPNSLSEAKYLKYLCIKGLNVGCNETEHRNICLSTHEQLQVLEIENCKYLGIVNVHSITLRSCLIKNCILSHNQCEIFTSALQNASGIEELVLNHIRCDKKYCEGHLINLENAKQMQSLTMRNCENLCVSAISQNNLRSCKVDDCIFTHEQHALFSTLLCQSLFLRHLILIRIRCTSQGCEGHSADLTHCEQMKTLILDKCEHLLITNVCSSKLRNCNIEQFLCFSSQRPEIVVSHLQLTDFEDTQNVLDTGGVSQRTKYDRKTKVVRKRLKREGVLETYGKDTSRTIFLREDREHVPSFRKETQNLALIVFTHSCSKSIDHVTLRFCTVTDCYLPHNQYTLLLLKLEEAAYLQRLELRNIKCVKNSCDGHAINLAKLKHLEELTLTNCKPLSVSHECSVNLISFTVKGYNYSVEHGTQSLATMANVVALDKLVIEDSTIEQKNREEQSIVQSKMLHLQEFVLVRCKNLCVSNLDTSVLTRYDIRGCTFSHEQYTAITTSLRLADQISYLSLNHMRCSSDHQCQGHSIDLSSTTHLKTLKIQNCNNLRIVDISSKSLERCWIDNYTLSHWEWKSLLSSIEQAVHLRYIKFSNIRFDTKETELMCMDLTKHHKLQFVTLMACNDTFFSNIYVTKIISLAICNQTLTHQNCLTLSTELKQAVSLKCFKISHARCKEDLCEGHEIDITETAPLISIQVLRCKHFYLSHCSPSLEEFRLDDCCLSHEAYKCLAVSLMKTKSLKSFEWNNIQCAMAKNEGPLKVEDISGKHDGCKGHAVDLTQHEELKNLSIQSCNHLFLSGLNCSGLISFSADVCFCEQNHLKVPSSLAEAVYLRKLRLNGAHCSHKKPLDYVPLNLAHCSSLQIVNMLNVECIPILNVEKLEIFTFTNCVLQHDQYSLLCSLFQQAIHLRQIKVCNIKCSQSTCSGHNIDLTNHTHLLSLTLVGCERLRVSGLTSDMLESCVVRDCEFPHNQCEILVSFLREVVTLHTLTLSNVRCTQDVCEGHLLELLKLSKLKNLALVTCKQFYVSRINSRVIESCTIQDFDILHQKYSQLLSDLTDSAFVNRLKLCNIKCLSNDECTGHTMNMSQLARMQSLIIMSCKHLRVSNITSNALEVLKLGDSVILHEQLNQLTAFLATAFSLKQIKLHSIRCGLEGCEGHAVDLSNLQQLQYLVLENCEQLYRVNTK